MPFLMCFSSRLWTCVARDWYHTEMRPVIAKWMLLWLESNHVAGLCSEQIEAYILGQDVGADGGAFAALDSKGFKLLNLTAEWLKTYLCGPHF